MRMRVVLFCVDLHVKKTITNDEKKETTESAQSWEALSYCHRTLAIDEATR